MHNMAYILHLYQQPGYDSETTPRKHANSDAPAVPDTMVLDVPQDKAKAITREVDGIVKLGDDDQANEEFAGVLEFLAGLMV